MKYAIEVLVRVKGAPVPMRQWRKMRPMGGQPYTWDTREEAEKAMRMWHPSAVWQEDVRVVEVEE